MPTKSSAGRKKLEPHLKIISRPGYARKCDIDIIYKEYGSITGLINSVLPKLRKKYPELAK